MTTFIGPIAKQGGPAIKNALTLKYLAARDINVINTYGTSPVSRFISFAKTLQCRDDQILIGVSKKGRALLWPIVRLKALLPNGPSYCLICIGGTVAEEAISNHRLIDAMVGADVVAVETVGVQRKLAELGIARNVFLFPNFVEDLNNANHPIANVFQDETMHCVFLSSVRDKKGIKTMVKACQSAINAGCKMTLDIYGPIKRDFDHRVFDDLDINGPIAYKGAVQKEQVMNVLASYDCFVFPSEYEAEGFPSVLAEAMAVGLPVIASDVCYNREIVGSDGGWIFEAGNQAELASLFLSCAKRPRELKRISCRNVNYAQRWDASQVVHGLANELKERGWSL